MRVAVIGAGVSGLVAARLLARAHDVTVFEQSHRAGGHVHTAFHNGLALDMGFLVHNETTYPQLTRLLRELGVRTQPAEMSFSVSCDACGLEWSGQRPFAQRRRLADPHFLLLVREVARWLRTARQTLADGGEERTLEEHVGALGFSRRFRSHFLVPLTSALWSAAPERALELPATLAVRFLDQHGMLGFRRLQWLSIVGGADMYVRALLARLEGRVRVGLGVRSLRRIPGGVDVRTEDGEISRFDRIVVATHADQALALLEDPDESERRVLGAFRSSRNEAVLHRDSRLLPKARGARAAWNVQRNGRPDPTVTYYLNRLQQLESDDDWCVTLNRTGEIDPASIVAQVAFAHPLFTVESLRAQRELPTLSGIRGTFYAGAYHGFGFHEDGVASGARAAAALGAPW